MGSLAAAAEDAAAKGVSAVVKDARGHQGAAVRWGAIAMMFGMLCATIYLVIRDAAKPHGITQEEMAATFATRDLNLSPATDKALAALSKELAATAAALLLRVEAQATALAKERGEADSALRRDIQETEARLRGEIQGTNARIDRVLEAVKTPK